VSFGDGSQRLFGRIELQPFARSLDTLLLGSRHEQEFIVPPVFGSLRALPAFRDLDEPQRLQLVERWPD
jgi:hypothetical protein